MRISTMAAASPAPAVTAERRFDVAIYGGTAGGVVSAIGVARENPSRPQAPEDPVSHRLLAILFLRGSAMVRRTCALVACLLMVTPAQAASSTYDVVVYGGTAGGVVAAITAAQEGATVAVLEPTQHVGGMVTGGLGRTDKGLDQSIGGMSRHFYERVYNHYEQPGAWKHGARERALADIARGMVNDEERVWWSVEPSVAAAVLNRMAAEAKVKVLTGQRLTAVQVTRGRIKSITTVDGDVFAGRMFIDATYEGDLLALAGVPYRVGRESREEYGEKHAGVVPVEWSTRKQWDVDIRPFSADGKLLYGVQNVSRGEDGQGDRKVQAYNYRICLTDVPENRIPITRPENYDPTRYDLLALYIAAKGDQAFIDGTRGSLLRIDPLPNRKTDINDGGPFSTDYIGANWMYPDGDFETRQRILQDHRDYTRGLLYFLGHDDRVPQRIRQQMQQWGYPKDEYVTSDHWSPQLYIREARRMVGEYVMTQNDIQRHREKSDSVGMGSYNIDSHHIQRIINADGFVRNEGNPNDFTDGRKTYEIPYRCLTPRKADCENLLVTFCVSASHMGFSSLRMEPVFMILSESAGVAATMAVKQDLTVQKVPIQQLQERLHSRRQRLWLKHLATEK